MSSLVSCEIAVLFPTVWEFLSACVWPDGSSRVTGTILLLTESGMVKAAVHDRDAGISTFVSAKSLTGLLTALEEGLGGEGLEWRAKPYEKFQPRRRGS